jgi:hypothetical protein
MEVQLRLLVDDDEDCEQDAKFWTSLPESTRRDLCERFADVLVAVVRSVPREEHPNVLEDHGEASEP